MSPSCKSGKTRHAVTKPRSIFICIACQVSPSALFLRGCQSKLDLMKPFNQSPVGMQGLLMLDRNPEACSCSSPSLSVRAGVQSAAHHHSEEFGGETVQDSICLPKGTCAICKRELAHAHALDVANRHREYTDLAGMVANRRSSRA